MSRHPEILPPCLGCARAMTKNGETRQPGMARYDGHGYCEMCAARKRRGITSRAFTRGDTTYLLSDQSTPVCGRDNVNPEWWYPDDSMGVRHAKWLCAQCPVLGACREDALATTAVHMGVVGGLSRDERNKLRKQRKVA